MSGFLHELASELRTREQYLEDHNEHPVFAQEGGDRLRDDYQALVARVKDFARVVEEAHTRGDAIDVAFRAEISDQSRRLEVEIATWRQTLN